MSVKPILTVLKLPHCWVCQERFPEDGGTDAALVRNEHHVVPQAYGGRNGPTVSLCSAHHDLLHLIADKKLSGAKYHLLLVGVQPDQSERLLYLANVVASAARATANDPNKPFPISAELPATYRSKVAALKVALHCRNTRDLLLYLIDAEHNRRLPSQRPSTP